MFRVAGDSMTPALHDGDFVLSLRVPKFCLTSGAIVVVADSHRGRVVKRLKAIEGSVVELRGDNAKASTDSRTFGPVPVSALEGRVLMRIRAPRTRQTDAQVLPRTGHD